MSRLTGTDAYSLMAAYNNVYAPQELTEEQVWEEVETWVNSLIEEGYDLSEYTWEEMYESYIEEQGRGTRTGSNPNISQNPIVQAIRGDGPSRTLSAADRSRANARPSRPSPTFQNTGGFGRYAPPSAQVKTPAPTRTPASDLKAGTRDLLNRTPAPTRTPAATAPATQKPTATGTQKPTATPTPAPSASPARPSLSSQADEIRKMRAGSLQRQGKALDAANVSATTRPAYQANSFDPFDVVIGHLLDEGYADTEDAALAIMANMSEEWKETILDEAIDIQEKLKKGTKGRIDFTTGKQNFDQKMTEKNPKTGRQRATSPMYKAMGAHGRARSAQADAERSGDTEKARKNERRRGKLAHIVYNKTGKIIDRADND